MDLVQTVRKEGSRGNLAIGGNVDWSKIASDSQRENYLGHSVHAPVGRWQKGRDLNWYARANKSAFHIDDEEKKQIEEEKRQIKEREAAMMDEILGTKRPGPANSSASNVNLTPLGPREAQSRASSAVAQTNADRGDYEDDLGAGGSGRGIGYGKRSGDMGGERDVLEGEGFDSRSTERDSRRHRSSRHHHRSHHENRRDRSRDRHHRHHHRRSHRSRSRSREYRSRRHEEERPREREHPRSRNYDEERPRERYRSRYSNDKRPREREGYGRRHRDEERPREREPQRNRNYNNRTRSCSPERPRRGHYDERSGGREHRGHRHHEDLSRSPEDPPARREPSCSPRPKITFPEG